MAIKLEVGKAYRNRNGEIVTIVAENHGEIMQFVDSDGETYRSDGVYVAGYCSLSDLVQEFTHFSTHQEIYKYLVNGGYVTQSKDCSFLIGFNTEGVMYKFDLFGVTLSKESWRFDIPHNWTIAVPKASEWYDNIPEQGVLCWCNGNGTAPAPHIIVKYNPKDVHPFRDNSGYVHTYAVPVKLDELTKYILESKNETN